MYFGATGLVYPFHITTKKKTQKNPNNNKTKREKAKSLQHNRLVGAGIN